MPDNVSTPVAQKKIEYRVPPQGLFSVYANNVQMATTSFDVRVVFGQVAEVLEDKVMVDQVAQVTMTWLEAKILADFLQANINAHEDLNGPLKLPKNPPKIVVPQTFGPLP
jgi:Protein of unknown function (DUF3467)